MGLRDSLLVARSLQGRRVEVQEPGLMANSLVFDGKSEENAGNHPKRWD
jgi:hypothetical protein